MHSRLALAALVFTLAAAPGRAQAWADEHEHGGGVTLEALSAEHIRSTLDIPYAETENPHQRLDLYLPKVRWAEKLPVIVFFHGGGWYSGDKAAGASRLLPFVRTGDYAGVSVGYRWSSEAGWPAQIHDSKAAIRWIRANADKFELDPERIAVWGRSSGAHIALMLGLTSSGPELEGDVGPHTEFSSDVSAVANFCGVTDIPALVGESTDIDRTGADAPEALMLGGPILELQKKAREASPINYVTPGDPPVLTIHGTADEIVPYDQATRLHEALTHAGVPNDLITIRGVGHTDFPEEANDRTADFFAKVLLNNNTEISTDPL